MARITEDHLEQQCLEWFQNIGYTHVFTLQLDSDGTAPERSDYRQVILAACLCKALQRFNPGILSGTIDSTVLQRLNPNVPGLLASNRQFQGRKACRENLLIPGAILDRLNLIPTHIRVAIVDRVICP